MTLIIIAIFFIAIITAFGMLFFRAWELRTGRVTLSEKSLRWSPQLSYRQTEKTVLYLTKYVIQGILFTGAKYWFIATTKAKKEIKKLPKVHALLKKKPVAQTTSSKISFLQRSVIESKMKIRRIKERVKKEHGEKPNEATQIAVDQEVEK